MNIAVRYFTRSGNTQKLAEAIGEAVKTPALPITEPLPAPVELLFLGGSVYAGGIDQALTAFIAGLGPDAVKKAAIFSTAAILPSAYPQIKKQLEARGIEVAAEEYHCRGKFSLLHKSRPNAQDLGAAAAFAAKLSAV
ncbi:MAG: flavodoxin [Peptococcaceae bacterium]|jgi:flavodoxin|nr:flavodoxin [Peptococcaceae bacterium]